MLVPLEYEAGVPTTQQCSLVAKLLSRMRNKNYEGETVTAMALRVCMKLHRTLSTVSEVAEEGGGDVDR